MDRIYSNNYIDPRTGRLVNGYDYMHQAWVVGGQYINCGHPDTSDCDCYGRLHEGEICKVNGL